MKLVYINNDVSENQVKKLLNFAIEISNTVSFAKYYEGELTQEEYDAIQNEYKALILEEDKKRRARYADISNGYSSKLHQMLRIGNSGEAENYFDELLRQDMESLNHLPSRNAGIKAQRYHGDTKAYLYTRFTRVSPVTKGPVFEICYFDKDLFDEAKISLNSLFAHPVYLNNFAFEDIALYRENRVVLAVCTHEHFANMDLDEEEYRSFLSLDIMHKAYDYESEAR